ncbi:MAG: DUF1588 domain-containing protein [Nannocystaceae bacterium]|nr:DUF1588 domain-containing protein [Nannocystaceae bacterium]
MASFARPTHPKLPWGTAALTTVLLTGCYRGPPASTGETSATDSDGDPTAPTSGPGTDTTPTDTAQDSSNDTEEGGSSGGEDVEPPPTYPIRRLTSRELDKTLRAAFELDPDFSDYFLPLEPDEPLQVFSNEVAGLVVGAGVLEAQLEIMERFSNRMAAQDSTSPPAFTDCEAVSERACLEAFVHLVGSRLFRRPVTDEQTQQLLAVYDNVLVDSDANVAYSALVLAMVLSPRTLYLLAETEDQRSWGVAERLSFFVWGAGPDDELRGLAADESILDPEVLHAQATRLLADDRARNNLGLFYFELLDLTRFEHYFKGFEYESDIGLSRSVIQADFLDAAFAPYSEGGTLESLLTEPLSFSDPAFAENYPGDYPGLLSHPAFTWTHAANRSTHPVGRGVTVRERLLCQDLGAPPMDISAIPDNVDENATMRERLSVHREDPACSGCHNLIDPLGLPFEGYDWVGRARDLENGAPVDVSGLLSGAGNDVEVDGVFELGLALSETDAVKRCIVQQTLRFALLRETDEADDRLLQDVLETFTDAEDRLDALVLAVATSDAILQPQGEP